MVTVPPVEIDDGLTATSVESAEASGAKDEIRAMTANDTTSFAVFFIGGLSSCLR
jgi:hypothetical protein